MTRKPRPVSFEHKLGQLLYTRMEYIRARLAKTRADWLDRAIFNQCLADERELAARQKPRARRVPVLEEAVERMPPINGHTSSSVGTSTQQEG